MRMLVLFSKTWWPRPILFHFQRMFSEEVHAARKYLMCSHSTADHMWVIPVTTSCPL
jgi:hypothetical protein